MNFCLSTATSSRCKRLVYTARLATILVPKAANKHPPSLTRRWRRERRPENAAASNVCMRTSFVPTHWLFPSSLQMPITIGNRKVQANTMKAYRERQWQYNCNPCQLVHVSPGNALLISVCLLMLPMLGLATEHVQLTTMCHTKPINQWHLHEHHMTFHKAPLMLPSLNNILPAMGIQNGLTRSNIKYLSSQSSTCHVFPSPAVFVAFCLGRMIIGVVVVLLLLRCGDVETNPGPVGKCTHSIMQALSVSVLS